MKIREVNLDFHAFRRTGSWRPDLRMGYRREMGDETTNAQVNYSGDAASQFAVQGLPVPIHTFLGNFGLIMRTASGLQYTVDQDATGEGRVTPRAEFQDAIPLGSGQEVGDKSSQARRPDRKAR